MFFSGWLVASALALADEPARTAHEDAVESRRVVWPVVVEARRANAKTRCEALRPEDVQVFEDGEARPVGAIERRPARRRHLLVFDVSGGMGTRLHAARRAAVEYIESLPADEEVAVAEFAEDLRLLSAPSLMRDEARRALSELEPGQGTAMLDALQSAITWLRDLPGRSVLLVLSDGEDNASLAANDCASLADLAASASSVTIFTVGVDLRGRTPHPPHNNPAICLERVARATGGRLQEVSSARSRLGERLEDVRRELDARRYLSYVPAPLGQGVKDASAEEPRARRVRIEARPEVPCRVLSRGPARRTEWPPSKAALEAVTLSSHEGGGWTAAWTSSAPFAAEPASLTIEPDGTLRGHFSRLVRARGLLYEPERYWRKGRWRLQGDRRPEFATRAIALRWPAPAELSALREPHEVLRYGMRHGGDAPVPLGENAHARPDWLVHTSAFFELRRGLAALLVARDPALRARLGARLRAERRASAAPWLRELASQDPEEAARFERTLDSAPFEPTPSERVATAAAWLGDVRVRDAALRLDRVMAAEWLAGEAHVEADFERWPHLVHALSVATHARVLVSLVPATDEAGQRVGFYRWLLPAPRQAKVIETGVPERPPLTGLVRQFLALAGDAPWREGLAIQDARVGEGDRVVRLVLTRGGETEWLLAEEGPQRCLVVKVVAGRGAEVWRLQTELASRARAACRSGGRGGD